MNHLLFLIMFIVPMSIHGIVNANTNKSESAKKTKLSTPASWVTSSISSNPAAVNVTSGTGIVQSHIEKILGIQNNHGILIQGAWIADTNKLFSGGIEDAERRTSNSVFLADLTIKMEQFNGWKGGLFSAQFLQQNAQNTNAQAGIVQGYNSLPDVAPFNRSELYAIWYRQEFFDKKLFVRIGKTITTLDFNNVVKPAPLNADAPNIPAVTSLIYTPIFINPAVDGVMPGYTNSAYGITTTFTPINQWYLSYGIYDGNLASGKQTGLTGPTFNGRYFQVAETGGAWILGKDHMPGTAGIGLWHQTGLIRQHDLSESEATGAYLFGSQRLWYRHPGYDTSGISAFYQYSINNSSALPMKQSVGAGLTAFGLVANREADSIGGGFSLAWLNHRSTNQPTELMYQIYYQAKIITNIYLEPALSYIPNPGQNANLPPAFAGTIRAIVLA
ncbi:MAG: carbohydrate porin [Legionella longbeachae]|nr:carbohydrate porin [Legionella longbeachae]